MANKRNLKVDLTEFEETPKQSNVVTQTRNNAETLSRSNSVIQQPGNISTQALTNTPTRVKRTVPRSNGCTYYIEDSHKQAIKMIKAYNDVDKQDVVRTALDIFLRKYMKPDGTGLTEEGIKEINNYIWIE